jgi:hypothetical protein
MACGALKQQCVCRGSAWMDVLPEDGSAVWMYCRLCLRSFMLLLVAFCLNYCLLPYEPPLASRDAVFDSWLSG